MSPPASPPPAASDALRRDLAAIALAVAAVVLAFVNGGLAGPPDPVASIDLRYALVVGGAALGLLATIAWRASTLPGLRGRAQLVLVLGLLVPVLFALRDPRDPVWASAVTLQVLLASLLLVVGAAWRIGRAPGPRRGARIAAALFVLLAWIGPWTTLCWGLLQSQLALAPMRLAHRSPLRHAREEEVEFRAADGLLIRGTYTPGRRGAPAVVLLHGVADGRTQMAGWAALVADERGHHALRIDLRGHGRSEGSVVTYGDRERLDLEAAFEWLRARDDVDGTKILVVGASMGGSVALSSTSRLVPRGLRGIVAFAPVSDYAPIVARRLAPLGLLAPVARFVVEGVARGLGHVSPFELAPGRELERGPSVPVLVFHGDRDTTIPVALSEDLARRVEHVELHVVPDVGHEDIVTAVLNDPPSRLRVLRFLRLPRVRD